MDGGGEAGVLARVREESVGRKCGEEMCRVADESGNTGGLAGRCVDWRGGRGLRRS